jgi:Ni/Co efflux regulator RcnB
MKKLAIAFAVSAAALLGGSAANAADNTVKAKAATDVSQSTDLSSRGRHYRHHHRMHRHSGHRHYRPHFRSYGYAPRPYYRSYGYAPRPHYRSYGGYAPQRYYGVAGPGISFGFGGGGYRGW